MALSTGSFRNRTMLNRLLSTAHLLWVAPLLVSADTLLSRAGEPARPARFEVEALKDVTYYDGAGADKARHKLDLYLPKDQKDFPVLFFVHGGAWQRGDKDQYLGLYGKLGKSFASQGVGTVVINYRLSPTVQHPEHVKDVARAFAWTYKNIARYGGRPDQIFVFGHSAGGHLVALLATDDAYLKALGLGADAIKGVIGMSGVYSIPANIFPRVFGTDPGARKQASPIEHVRPGLPPFLLLYADNDLPGCDKEPCDAFCKALKEKGNKVQEVEVKDSNHYLIIMSTPLPEEPAAKEILSFIKANTAK
jgi:acetyl esterase/lipase